MISFWRDFNLNQLIKIIQLIELIDLYRLRLNQNQTTIHINQTGGVLGVWGRQCEIAINSDKL